MLGDNRWTDAHGTVHIIRPHTDPVITVCRQLVDGEPARPRVGCETCVLTTAVEIETQRLEELRAKLAAERKAALADHASPAPG
jgi:hypothetical protein